MLEDTNSLDGAHIKILGIFEDGFNNKFYISAIPPAIVTLCIIWSLRAKSLEITVTLYMSFLVDLYRPEKMHSWVA